MSNPQKKRSGALSSGGRPRLGLRSRRPNRAADEAGGGIAAEPKSNVFAGIIRGVAAVIFIGLLLLVSLWVILGLTVLPVIQAGGTPWLVKWAAWPEGSAPAGSVVMATSAPKESGLGSRFSLLLGGSDTNISKVVAGPGGEIKAGPDLFIYYNDMLTPWRATEPIPPTKLGDRYLVECLVGPSCVPGEFELLPVNQVLGEVMGSVGLSLSLGPVPEPLPRDNPITPAPQSPSATQTSENPTADSESTSNLGEENE